MRKVPAAIEGIPVHSAVPRQLLRRKNGTAIAIDCYIAIQKGALQPYAGHQTSHEAAALEGSNTPAYQADHSTTMDRYVTPRLGCKQGSDEEKDDYDLRPAILRSAAP